MNGRFDTLKLHNQIYLRDLSARKFLQLPAHSSCNHSDEKMHTKESSEFAFRIPTMQASIISFNILETSASQIYKVSFALCK